MKKEFIWVNVLCYGVISMFLGMAVITSLCSGYPWSLTCYNCASCNKGCLLGINAKGFVSAAMADDPLLYICADNIRLRLNEAAETDPNMIVKLPCGTRLMAGEAVSKGVDPCSEVITEMIRAKDAAQFCLVCGACEKKCPISLPILEIIEDLRDDGRFNR